MDQRVNPHSCQQCREGAFDARIAFQKLAHQQAQLANILSAYMSQAGLGDRTLRTTNALALAEQAERIVGGVEAQPGEFPECCLIGFSLSENLQSWFCTGVLVHPRVVLTAAHCHLPPRITSNVVALNTINKDRMGADAEVIKARMAAIHPDYLLTSRHDICVLILQQSARSRPVRVATTSDISAAGATTLVGFGNDNAESTRGFGIKRKVRVDFVSLRRSLGEDLSADEQRFHFDSRLEFVAGGAGFDTCNGDSGGPAYIQVGADIRVAGLTSRGFNNSIVPCGEGGVYTRVDQHVDFIQRIMRDNDLDPNEL